MTLPEPDPAFHWTRESWGDALRCRRLSPIAQHAFTTRQLALRRPEPFVEGSPEAGEYGRLWSAAAASVGGTYEQTMRVRQVHGAVVRVIRRGTTRPGSHAERPEGDAIVSNDESLTLAVVVADCVPILIADPVSGAAAAVHAGWRGTSAGIARAAVDTLATEFGTAPADLVAAVGPSIGRCCYIVGVSVRDAFQAAGGSDEQVSRWFSEDEDGALRLDLWSANRDQLIAAGVPPAQIHVCGLCTQTHATVFESYRAEGEKAGRMAGLIRVPAASGRPAETNRPW